MTLLLGIVTGIVLVLVVRIAAVAMLTWKLRRDVAALGRGDYAPLLSGYADDAVLDFNDGDHRWAGEHRGKAAIEGFLQSFVAAGLHGEIRCVYVAGWPWNLTILARFDDAAEAPDGEHLYDNRTVLLCRTRWGKIVRQEDYYYDTVRMDAFEQRLSERGL